LEQLDMKIRRRQLLQGGLVALGAAGGLGSYVAERVVAQSRPPYSTPILACGESTQVSIDIVVSAGSTGAPSGFSLQWMTASDYAANGNVWYLSDDPRLCKASFSGNASLSRYNLKAGESVTVKVGDFLFDNGASTNCLEPLVCGTAYVFRVFAHGDNKGNRSAFTANLTCSTLPCGHSGGCTYTQGYWKTHGPIPKGMNSYVWPESVKTGGMTLGSVSYTADQLLLIFNKPSAGNGLIVLAHQLIAAKLNVANGADPTVIVASIAAADLLIGQLVVPPIGAGTLPSASTGSLTEALADYNEGGTGPGHCG
jgi:hypothetical protein